MSSLHKGLIIVLSILCVALFIMMVFYKVSYTTASNQVEELLNIEPTEEDLKQEELIEEKLQEIDYLEGVLLDMKKESSSLKRDLRYEKNKKQHYKNQLLKSEDTRKARFNPISIDGDSTGVILTRHANNNPSKSRNFD